MGACFSHILRAPDATGTPFSSVPAPPSISPGVGTGGGGRPAGLGSPEQGEAMSAAWIAGLFTWLPRRLGEGLLRGGENPAFKGAPPGAGWGWAAGAGGQWGSAGTATPPPHPCSSPGPSLEPSQPYPGAQGRPPVPTDPPRLIGPRDGPPPLPTAPIPSMRTGQWRPCPAKAGRLPDHSHPGPRCSRVQGAGQTGPVSGTLWGPRSHVRGRVGGPGLCSHGVSPPWGLAKVAWIGPWPDSRPGVRV